MSILINIAYYFIFSMESFQDTALQMLREFRKLLSNTPIPIIPTRFLQYLALNMFSIEYSRPKG